MKLLWLDNAWFLSRGHHFLNTCFKVQSHGESTRLLGLIELVWAQKQQVFSMTKPFTTRLSLSWLTFTDISIWPQYDKYATQAHSRMNRGCCFNGKTDCPTHAPWRIVYRCHIPDFKPGSKTIPNPNLKHYLKPNCNPYPNTGLDTTSENPSKGPPKL